MSGYSIILHIHSVLRYFVLVLILVAIFNSIRNLTTKSGFDKKDLKIALGGLIAFHIQFLIGIVMYFLSPKVIFSHVTMKVELIRFFTVEHGFLMSIAFVLITMGYSKAKKYQDLKGHKTVLTYYSLALLAILIAIPWPFRLALGSNWI